MASILQKPSRGGQFKSPKLSTPRGALHDAAKYLKTDDEMAIYLEESARSRDPAVMVAALSTIAGARDGGQLNRDTGLTREGISKALSPGGNPAFATIVKIAQAMGFELAFRANLAS